MIRYVAYIGPKEIKRVENDKHVMVDFPREKTVDALKAGFNERRIKDLLRSGIFQLRGEINEAPRHKPIESEPMMPVRNICGCGFVAKTKAGLKAHQRRCDAC